MDQYATVDGSVEQVFAGAADPARLVDWLPDVVRVDLDANALVEAGSVFTLTLRDSRPAGGEVVAYEPPRLVAYRVFLPQPRVLRVVCTAHSVGRVRVHLYQTDSPTPIAADLPRLALLRSPPVRGPEIKTSPSGGAWGSSSGRGPHPVAPTRTPQYPTGDLAPGRSTRPRGDRAERDAYRSPSASGLETD